MESIVIGRILKPQGIKGELKVLPITDDANRYKSLKNVIIDGKTYKVLGAKVGGEYVYLSLLGVTDRNCAETFRDKEISVKREDAVKLPEGRYFIAEITGSKVYFEDGEELGEVEEVVNAKTDYFTVKTVKGGLVRFPFLKDLAVSVDASCGKVVLNRKRFNEVACYED